MSDEGTPSDDVRLLRLLWRGDELPSARSGLTVDRVVASGVSLADGSGLAAVSMRRVAQDLGVGAMSLYTYVPGRTELVLLMADHVVGELVAAGWAPGERSERDGGPEQDPAGRGATSERSERDRGPDQKPTWRAGLRRMAEDFWALLERHPWLLDVPLTRTSFGPNAVESYEAQLAVVDGLGLDPLEMNAVLELVNEHVAGAARRLLAIRADQESSGISDDDWWYGVEATLVEVMAGKDYPLAGRVGVAVGAPHLDTSYLLQFGLERILDGLETLIATRRESG